MTATTIASPPLRRAAYVLLTLALFTLLIVEAIQRGDWAALASGLIAPDLALGLGFGSDLARGQLHPRAVGIYNALHRFSGPMALLAVAFAGGLAAAWFVLGLAWAAHIALDRSCGYGLRDARGFQRDR